MIRVPLPVSGMVVLWAFVSLTACGDDGGTRAARAGAPLGHAVRDSAGIRIVESTGPAWSGEDAWRLSRRPVVVVEASDGSEENLLLDPGSVDEDSRGRILVGDGRTAGWHAVLVFDSRGRFLFRVGREGEGPGEFGQLWWAEAYRGDSLVAFDIVKRRLNVFGPEGNFARAAQVPNVGVARGTPGAPGFAAGAEGSFGDGSFLVFPRGRLDVSEDTGPAWFRHLLLRLAPDGGSWDTLGTFPIRQHYWDGNREQPYRYGLVAVRAVYGEELYFGSAEDFEIRVHGPDGALGRIVRRAHEPRPVTDEELARYRRWWLERAEIWYRGNRGTIEELGSRRDAVPVPDVLPAYSAALVDEDGNLWVEEYRWTGPYVPPDPEPAHWSVFDPEGVWLGRVEVPARFLLKKVTRERAYGIVIDELDVKEVHAYRIDKP